MFHIWAIHYQVVPTNTYLKRIIRDNSINDILCRMCNVQYPIPTNIKKKRNEIIQKYLPFTEEKKPIWETNTIPTVLGATGKIPNKILKYLKPLGIKNNSYLELQKDVILSICNLIEKVMNIRQEIVMPISCHRADTSILKPHRRQKQCQ